MNKQLSKQTRAKISEIGTKLEAYNWIRRRKWQKIEESEANSMNKQLSKQTRTKISEIGTKLEAYTEIDAENGIKLDDQTRSQWTKSWANRLELKSVKSAQNWKIRTESHDKKMLEIVPEV